MWSPRQPYTRGEKEAIWPARRIPFRSRKAMLNATYISTYLKVTSIHNFSYFQLFQVIWHLAIWFCSNGSISLMNRETLNKSYMGHGNLFEFQNTYCFTQI